MNLLRSVLFGAAALAGTSLISMPAQADPDVGFYISPNGARIYYDDYGDDYYRPYYYRGYRGCHSQVWYSGRYRVVDRVCYNRFGQRYIADRDYYPRYGYGYYYDY